MSANKDTRSCLEWNPAPGYEGYNKVPCAACDSWNIDRDQCGDIKGVRECIVKTKARYEDSPVFDAFSRMMQDSVSIYIT